MNRRQFLGRAIGGVISLTLMGSLWESVQPKSVVELPLAGFPEGCIPCDGRTLKMSDYPSLYEALRRSVPVSEVHPTVA